jgi:FAD synthase
VPTANVEMTKPNSLLLKDVVPGIYMGWCHHNGDKYKTAVSVGWNPVYNNSEKTLEAHIISDNQLQDFYGEVISVRLLRYIRAEALYSDFDALIIAISSDIQATIDATFD